MVQALTQKAKEFAYKMHEGQKRKEGMPYITHPEGVVRILEEEGFIEDITLSTAWIHDTLEDTSATYKDIEKEFSKDVASRVYILTRNVNREMYKTRIKNSDLIVKIVKLADTLHNVHDPYSMSHLSEKGIKRKIDDCISFYIPLAMQVCPDIGYRLKKSINNYLQLFWRHEK